MVLVASRQVETDTTLERWISWRQVLELEDEAVAQLMIAQGTLEHRLSSKLNHADMATERLTWHQRHEFKYSSQSSQSQVVAKDQVTAKDDRAPGSRDGCLGLYVSCF